MTSLHGAYWAPIPKKPEPIPEPVVVVAPPRLPTPPPPREPTPPPPREPTPPPPREPTPPRTPTPPREPTPPPVEDPISSEDAQRAIDAASKKLKEALLKQKEYEDKVRQLQAEMEGLGYVKKQVKLVCRDDFVCY